MGGSILCTNHYIKRRPEKSEGFGSSQNRYEILLKLLQRFQASKSVIDVEKAINMLNSVARNGSNITYLSIIGFPRERRIYFAVSPKPGVSPTRGEWIEILWSEVFEVL